jgi:hypothetical protein
VQFAGCFEINPMNCQSTGRLKDLWCKWTSADCRWRSDDPDLARAQHRGAGCVCNLHRFPARARPSRVRWRASALCGSLDSAGLVYHPDAYASWPIPMPGGVGLLSASAPGARRGRALVKDYNIMQDQSPARVEDPLRMGRGARNGLPGGS